MLVVAAACGSSGPGASGSTTIGTGAPGASTTTTTGPPPQSSCDDATVDATTVPETEPVPGETTTTEAEEPPDAEFPQDEIPDGTWTGPIETAAEGHPNVGSGTVFNAGGGDITITMAHGKVIAGNASFNATSSGTVVAPGGSTGEVEGTLQMTGGAVTGDKGEIQIAGQAQQSGNIRINVHGTIINKPLNGTVTVTATLTVTKVGCRQLVATFLPDLNGKTGGRGTFTGKAEWHATRSS